MAVESGCVMSSCAIAMTMRVMALKLSSWLWETNYLRSSVGWACKFDMVCDREYVEEAGGTVKQDGLDNALALQ